MVRWFIILIETIALFYLFLENRTLIQSLKRCLGNAVNPDFWALQGVYLGTFLIVVSSGSGIIFLIFYVLFQKIPALLKKHSNNNDLDGAMIHYLLEQQKQKIEELELLKKETERELRELRKRHQLLKSKEIEYQRLIRKLHYKLEKIDRSKIIIKTSPKILQFKQNSNFSHLRLSS